MDIRYIGKGDKAPEPRKPTPKQEEREEAKAELLKARIRKENALAYKRETEAREKRSELIARPAALHQLCDMFVVIRQKLLGLPTPLARKLEGKTQHERKVIIDAELRGCLAVLSDPEVVLRGPKKRSRRGR